MSLSFKFVPLSFQKDQIEIKRQIRNTIILGYFFRRNDQTVSLGELIEGTQYGYNASALLAGNNKFLRISDITDGKVNWETVPFCDCADEETYLLFPDDILIARTGGTTGKSFKIESAPEKAIYAGYLIRVRANDDCLPDFLDVFLNSYTYWSQIVSLNEGEFRPSVNANKLKELLLPVCSKVEQDDIVRLANGDQVEGYEDLILNISHYLKEYDFSIDVCNCLESQKSLLSQLKQSILQEAIQGELTAEWRAKREAAGIETEPASELLKRIQAEKAKLIKEKKIKKEKPLALITEEEKPFELPEGWDWCRLGKFADVKRGKGPQYSENGVSKMINQKCVRWFDLEVFHSKSVDKSWFENLDDNFKIRYGDLLVNSTGDGTIGRSAIVDKSAEGFAFDSHVLKVRPYLGISSFYMAMCINSKYGQSLIEDLKGAKSTKQTELGSSNLSSFSIPVPSLEEQKAIVEKVESLMAKCAALETEINQSEAYAQQLMQAVLKESFEGK